MAHVNDTLGEVQFQLIGIRERPAHAYARKRQRKLSSNTTRCDTSVTFGGLTVSRGNVCTET
jgi:hypothetical protein